MQRPKDGLQPVAVQVRGLPAPDTLEFELPPGHVSLVADDGSGTAVALVDRLRALGWPVVMLTFAPDRQVSHTSSVPVVGASGIDEAAVREAIARVRNEHGPVGACIYLHPRAVSHDSTTPAGDPRTDHVLAPSQVLTSEDRALLAVPFLIAKTLQPDLTSAAALAGSDTLSRASFLTVTALDGVLGLEGGAGPMGGGVAGLTKTLRLEWPDVYCRAVDLDPRLSSERAADVILAELRDPNRLVAEVGYGEAGRVTLEQANESAVSIGVER